MLAPEPAVCPLLRASLSLQNPAVRWVLACPREGGSRGRSQCAVLSWGSPRCGAGCYELAGLVKSSTPVMVALQKKQSLLFIRCWLMQALHDLWEQGLKMAEMGCA